MKTAFLFTGQASQHPAMGRPFYDRYDEFRSALDRCAEHFGDHLDVSITDLLLDDGHTGLLEHTLYQQPALFALEYALAQLWISRGVLPDVVLGHSLGEIVATTVAECLGLSDAVALVARRARLMQDCAPGSMLAVAAPVDRALQLTSVLAGERGEHELAVAAINSPDRCVLAGAPELIGAAAELLRDARIPSSTLKVSHAFHSSLMTPAAHALGVFAATLRFQAPTTRVVSAALDGTELRLDTLEDQHYWVQQCLKPVNFRAAVETVSAHGPHAFIEIGPSHTLLRFAQRCAPAADHQWLRSAAPTDVACALFEAGLGELSTRV